MHMLWFRLEVENYWKTILDVIIEVTSVDLPQLLKPTLLGDEFLLLDQKGTKGRFINITLLAAKKALLLYRDPYHMFDIL